MTNTVNLLDSLYRAVETLHGTAVADTLATLPRARVNDDTTDYGMVFGDRFFDEFGYSPEGLAHPRGN